MTKKKTKKKVVEKKKVLKKRTVVKNAKKTKSTQELLDDPKKELFCRLYVENDELRGNGGMCFAIASGIDLDKLDRTVLRDEKGDVIQDSEYNKMMNVCYVSANRLLRNVKISERMRKVLNEMLEDKIVDGELAKVILQNDELPAKISAIREYNKLKKRTIDRLEITNKRPFEDLTDEELAEAINDGIKFLRKK
ncbi:MAG TPA: hypothetical protein DIT25_03910 [Candidatus Moranbacteria bacterium]|nr:hypothetical protein [Candidatus Moranbacteria bacterium]